MIAFRVPERQPRGYLISAAHTDRPTFKLKENGEKAGVYTTVCVERYGGSLMFPWPDRPLSIAGRVLVETEQGAVSKLVDIDRDLLLIPNVAIHMNRQANDGYKWNPAVDLLPLIGGKDAAGKLGALLEEAAGGKILGSDLYLYTGRRPACGVWRANYSAQAWTTCRAYGAASRLTERRGSEIFRCSAPEQRGNRLFHHGGANSTILEDVLSRIALGLGWTARPQPVIPGIRGQCHAIHPNTRVATPPTPR